MATHRSGSAPDAPEAVSVGLEEGAKIFDRVAQRKLGISGNDFLRKWDAGEYEGTEEDVRAQEVAMLMPFVRPVPVDAR